ncbi:MAG: hypothetical protein SVK44_07820 [Nitrospirota bacterium]|nr:hypothetical protein [Nitrospirota bacterium]
MDPTYPGVSSQFWLLIPYFDSAQAGLPKIAVKPLALAMGM